MGRGKSINGRLKAKDVLFNKTLAKGPQRAQIKELIVTPSHNKEDFKKACAALDKVIEKSHSDKHMQQTIANSVQYSLWEYALKEAKSRLEYFVSQDKCDQYKPDDLKEFRELYEKGIYTYDEADLNLRECIRPLFWGDEGKKTGTKRELSGSTYDSDDLFYFFNFFREEGNHSIGSLREYVETKGESIDEAAINSLHESGYIIFLPNNLKTFSQLSNSENFQLSAAAKSIYKYII